MSEKLADVAVLDINGVGYGVVLTNDDYARFAIGDQVKLYIYEHIREQGHDLFGFSALDTKLLFEQLIGVKNVGPKVGMAVLDIGPANAVRAAIATGDVKLLQTAKGVGKRAAEQIVVELRDKVGLVSDEGAEGVVTRPGLGAQDEAAEALIALGYSPQDAALALKNIDADMPTEDRIKLALKGR